MDRGGTEQFFIVIANTPSYSHNTTQMLNVLLQHAKEWPEEGDDEDDPLSEESEWRAKVGDMLLIRPPDATIAKGVQPFWLGKVKAITPTGYAVQYWTRVHGKSHQDHKDGRDDPYSATYMAQRKHMNTTTANLQAMTFEEGAGCIQHVCVMAMHNSQGDRLRLNQKVDIKKVRYWATRWKGSATYDVSLEEGGCDSDPDED